MGDRLSFFSSQSPDSSRRHGNTQNARGQEFAPPWAIKPGTYGRDAHIHRARAEMKRLISTKGPTTSWLFSEHYSQPPKGGNHGPAPLQKKLTVGSVNDPLEKEADAVADRVMRNPEDCYLDPPVSPFRQSGQRKSAGEDIARQGAGEQEEETAQLNSEAPEISRMTGEEEEMQQSPAISRMGEEDEEMQQAPAISRMGEQDEEMQQAPMVSRMGEEEDMDTTTSMSMQRESAAGPEGGTVSNDVAQKIDGVRNSGGEKLPESEREFFESRMGHDFGDVRIHTGSEAAQVSRDVNAKAFTIGRDVVFGEEEYKPGTPEGRRLMAHELTHTVQQGAARQTPIRRQALPPGTWRYKTVNDQEPTEVSGGVITEVGRLGSAIEFYYGLGRRPGSIPDVSGKPFTSEHFVKIKQHIIAFNKIQATATRTPERSIGEYEIVVIPSLREARKIAGVSEKLAETLGPTLPVDTKQLSPEQKDFVGNVNLAIAGILAAASPTTLLLTGVLGSLGYRVTAAGIGIQLGADIGAAVGAGSGAQGMLFWDVKKNDWDASLYGFLQANYGVTAGGSIGVVPAVRIEHDPTKHDEVTRTFEGAYFAADVQLIAGVGAFLAPGLPFPKSAWAGIFALLGLKGGAKASIGYSVSMETVGELIGKIADSTKK